MAMNRYAKKVARQKERAAGRAADRLKDMSSYLGQSGDGKETELIPLQNIKLNEANDYRRLDREEDIQTLAEDIERNGLLHNLVVGVANGFERRLHMEGVGYRAQAAGKQLTLNVGFSHPVVIDAPENISFETPQPTEIVVKGIDKQQVGAVAADIRAIRKPEPYLGKGIRYVDEVVRRKEGKAGKK